MPEYQNIRQAHENHSSSEKRKIFKHHLCYHNKNITNNQSIYHTRLDFRIPTLKESPLSIVGSLFHHNTRCPFFFLSFVPFVLSFDPLSIDLFLIPEKSFVPKKSYPHPLAKILWPPLSTTSLSLYFLRKSCLNALISHSPPQRPTCSEKID